MKKVVVLSVAVALLALTGAVAAGTVNYTVTGLGPTNYPGSLDPRVQDPIPDGAPHLVDGLGYPGDAVTLGTYTGTLDLTPGTYVQKINTLSWSISYTYAGTDEQWQNDAAGDWLELAFAVAANRTMSFAGGSSGTLSQTGLLEVNWENDFLGLYEGATTTFYVSGYQVDVTPLSVARAGGSSFPGFPGGTPWVQPDRDIMARFVVTEAPVPEPISLVFFGTGLAGVVGFVARRRR